MNNWIKFGISFIVGYTLMSLLSERRGYSDIKPPKHHNATGPIPGPQPPDRVLPNETIPGTHGEPFSPGPGVFSIY